MPVDESVLEAYLDTLAEDYYDLQAPVPDVLPSQPSALAALRMISKAHPTVIHGFSPITPGAEERDWDAPAAYSGIQGDKEVTIAVTDDGLADSVRVLPDGSSTFVKPLDERMTMSAFLARLGNSQEKEALYLQSQDGNIFRSEAEREPELAPFQAVVARDIAWMAEATGHSAEAVNLWVGTSLSTTSFHHDPYENIYTVLSGSKTFTLVSPIDGLRLDQRFHAPSTLVRGEGGKLEPRPDEAPAHPVPWVQDLHLPDSVRPITVTLEKGESLYLPAGWWHKVEQNEGPGGLAVAVNYWYPAELRAERYALERFAQRVARTAGRDGVIPLPEDTLDDGIWGDDSDVTSADEWDPKDWGR